jgi:hypothetical protein
MLHTNIFELQDGLGQFLIGQENNWSGIDVNKIKS